MIIIIMNCGLLLDSLNFIGPNGYNYDSKMNIGGCQAQKQLSTFLDASFTMLAYG